VGLPPPPSLASLGLALALTVALAGCGGGTTGAPVAATTAAPSSQPAGSATAPRTTPAAPRATATPPPVRTPGRPAPGTGGAAASASSDPATKTSASPATSASKPASVPAAPTARPKPAASPIDELADLTLTSRASPAHCFQQGTVTGTYSGTMAAEVRITSRGVLVSFTATVPGGTIAGHALAVAILDSATWPALRGSGVITGGTGRFAGIHGRGLTVTGHARPDASQAHVRLAGTVSY
jgi:hypothetical protein